MNDANFTPEDHFAIGGEELLSPIETESVAAGSDTQESAAGRRQREALNDIRVRVGTLLKTETVSFLLGAGASVDCGGQLIGSVPLVVERDLHNEGITGTTRLRIRRWLSVFYLALRYSGGGDRIPVTHEAILARREALNGEGVEPIRANFERVLATLQRWRSALPETGGRLRMDGSPLLDAKADDLDAALKHATRALARACDLPTDDRRAGLATYKTIVRKLLTRPLNLKRVNVFTLNYDTLVEQASDAEGVVLLEGFIGTQRRVFRPESYEQDLYFPAETTEGRVHRFDRVLHLYKLHGSITWTANEPTIDDPYGVQSAAFDPAGTQPLLIYPTPAKYGETLGMPYSELFRRFAGALSRPQSVLFVVGYGFGDEHVNAIIQQALAVPSFTLVIVDPAPMSEFVAKLREQRDRRVWIAEGPTLGTLAGFVDQALPDLRDEEIRKKVLATHRALAKTSPTEGDEADGD
ncbi:MAG: SIR2 family protein [bacterium]|uniref:SIR2 family protein n=1 Tax=Candidatus Methylomirabilis tolerans TaxID=3123416 RepID=A0AAJ1AGZ6_9BACT|nr:SIR2 family protein [Candidatus Methylomirabilis sp.]